MNAASAVASAVAQGDAWDAAFEFLTAGPAATASPRRTVIDADCGAPAHFLETSMTNKPTADFHNFESLDIRTGQIICVEEARTKKPTYRIAVDLGPEIGTKISCGAYRNYPREFS